MRKTGGVLKKALLIMLGIALILAIIGTFQGDPFAVFVWLLQRCLDFVITIRDFLLGSDTFTGVFR